MRLLLILALLLFNLAVYADSTMKTDSSGRPILSQYSEKDSLTVF